MTFHSDIEQPAFDFTEKPRARMTDPKTSKDAAARIKPGRRLMVLAEFENYHNGSTTFEVAERMGVQRDNVSPHIKHLISGHLLEQAGFTRLNPNSGNACNVYKITAAGKYFLNSQRAKKKLLSNGTVTESSIPADTEKMQPKDIVAAIRRDAAKYLSVNETYSQEWFISRVLDMVFKRSE